MIPAGTPCRVKTSRHADINPGETGIAKYSQGQLYMDITKPFKNPAANTTRTETRSIAFEESELEPISNN